jgi:putative membrane protein
MDTAPEPFLLLEPDAAPRLEPVPSISPTAEPVRWRASPALVGAGILAFGFPILWAAWLISATFDHWGALDWAGLVVLLTGLSLIGVGIGRELGGLAALRRVDKLRAELASGEAARVEKAARRWLEALPQQAGILPALAATDTLETVLALLRAGPARALREATDVLGRWQPCRVLRSLRRHLRQHWMR